MAPPKASLRSPPGGISLVLIYGAALVAAVANPLTKRPHVAKQFGGLVGGFFVAPCDCVVACRRLEVRDQAHSAGSVWSCHWRPQGIASLVMSCRKCQGGRHAKVSLQARGA